MFMDLKKVALMTMVNLEPGGFLHIRRKAPYISSCIVWGNSSSSGHPNLDLLLYINSYANIYISACVYVIVSVHSIQDI